MKKRILLLLVILTIEIQAYSQTPQGLNYQAVARNVSGAILPNLNISILFTITNGNGGAVLYQESQTAVTNQFGLFTLAIGTGTPITGVFSAINWSAVTPWLQVGMDPTGGTGYVNMGSSQLLSVPYSLYSGASDNAGFSNMQVFSTPGMFVFTTPQGVKRVMVEVWGGGGGGGYTPRGGGGGGYGKGIYNVAPGDTHIVIVGNGIAGSSTVWQDGETSSFGSLIYATGGRSGYIGGLSGGTSNAPHAINGGRGGGDGGSNSYEGGYSPNGGSGGHSSQNGVEPGGGGGGCNPSPCGNGANGRVIVYW